MFTNSWHTCTRSENHFQNSRIDMVCMHEEKTGGWFIVSLYFFFFLMNYLVLVFFMFCFDYIVLTQKGLGRPQYTAAAVQQPSVVVAAGLRVAVVSLLRTCDCILAPVKLATCKARERSEPGRRSCALHHSLTPTESSPRTTGLDYQGLLPL